MRTVWKFERPVTDEFTLSVPGGLDGAQVRHVACLSQTQLTLWIEVDTGHELEPMRFVVTGTGHVVPEGFVHHVGTVLDGPFVWHVWLDERAEDYR